MKQNRQLAMFSNGDVNNTVHEQCVCIGTEEQVNELMHMFRQMWQTVSQAYLSHPKLGTSGAIQDDAFGTKNTRHRLV